MTFQDLNDQFDILRAAVVKEEADVTTFIAGLKAQIAAGSPVTQAQIDALGAKFAGINSMVSQFDLTTTAAPVAPAPLPPVTTVP